MKKNYLTLLMFGTAFGCLDAPSANAQPTGANTPASLEECYLKNALGKSTADMAYVAKEICQAAFAPARLSLFVFDLKTKGCTEWWFDPRGRYESAGMYCAWESAGKSAWTLSCQHKDAPSKFTLVELAEKGASFERQGELLGVDPGLFFKTMAACVRHKAKQG